MTSIKQFSWMKIFAVVGIFASIAFIGVFTQKALADHDPFGGEVQSKVDVCHVTGNGGYNTINVAISSSGAPQGGHDGHDGDIIPPYHWENGTYAGQNWDADTEAIWTNGCAPVEPEPVLGCTDDTANNYNSEATEDDGSCTYDPVVIVGCMDDSANNYNSEATEDTDPSSCTYDPEPILGCTDDSATNYNPNATSDDGSCTYPVLGCTNPSATNYDSEATEDDGSCEFPPDPVAGCTDAGALNYNPNATSDNGSCTYPVLGCTNPEATNYNSDATIGNADADVCTFAVLGCTDDTANNYNSEATEDDGSCTFDGPDPVYACSDDADNDDDGLTDAQDPGCHTDGDAGNPDSYDPTDNDETDAVTPPPSSGGGGRRSGGGGTPAPQGQVLGATTLCGVSIDAYLRKGHANNPAAVIKLQQLLSQNLGINLAADGVFGNRTEEAVKQFQAKYADKILSPWNLSTPTGIFYLSSLETMNWVMCPELGWTLPSLVPWSQNPVIKNN